MNVATRERVRELHEAGLNVRDIARVLNITTQMVYKHFASLGIATEGQKRRRAAS